MLQKSNSILGYLLVISIVAFYITYVIHYTELEMILVDSKLYNALNHSSDCSNRLLILISVLCTISIHSIVSQVIMGQTIRTTSSFSTALYLLSAVMTIDLYISRSPIKYIFYNAVQKLFAIWGGCVMFTLEILKIPCML